ncbi:hypothetical protein AB1L42_22835 [Thalassoglobus sp. JC818]
MTWGASLMRLPEGMTISEMAQEFGDHWQVPIVGSISDVSESLQ